MTAQAELDDPLLLQFAATRPAEMAALLSNTNLTELSDLIESLPIHSASRLAVRLPSWQLSGLLGVLEPAVVARMLTAAEADEGVALVSHLHESRYAAILDTVPAPQRRALYELLEFPSHTVASMVTTEFIRVAQNTLCSVFAEQMSDSTDTSPQPVLVVDQQGRYLGMLNLQAVFARKNRTRPVGDIMIKVEPLNGLTDSSAALTARQWMKYSELPVVDNRHRILGIVSRAALGRVVGDTVALEFNFEQVVSELAIGYLNSCARVLEAVLGKPE